MLARKRSFGEVLAKFACVICVDFVYFIYKETYLFLVSYKPIHIDFSKKGGGPLLVASTICIMVENSGKQKEA